MGFYNVSKVLVVVFVNFISGQGDICQKKYIFIIPHPEFAPMNT